VFGLALDLDKLTTRKGAKIEVHFEDISNKILLKKQYSHSEFLRKVNNDIDQWGGDNDHDTVHLLINNQGTAALITETLYTKWQNAAEKDWFHKGIMAVIISDFHNDENNPIEEILSILGLRPNDLLFGGKPKENDQQFVGMTEEELVEFLADRENLKNIKAVEKANPDHCCKFCPFPCLGRNESFNRMAFEQAVTALQLTTTKE